MTPQPNYDKMTHQRGRKRGRENCSFFKKEKVKREIGKESKWKGGENGLGRKRGFEANSTNVWIALPEMCQ